MGENLGAQPLAVAWRRACCVFIGFVLLGLASSCAKRTVFIAPAASIWNDKTAVIGIAVTTQPIAAPYREGQQGLLDMAINSAATSDLSTHLKQFSAGNFLQTQIQLGNKLKARGLTVKIIAAPLYLRNFPARDTGTDKRLSQHDYSGLRASEGIDRLLLLSIDQFGTIRSYYGFAPTSAPTAMAKISGQLIDVSSGELLWSISSLRKQEIAPPWDAPPDYPSIDAAIHAAIASASNSVMSDLVY